MAQLDGGLLVAVGVGEYDHDSLLELVHARTDVEGLRALLPAGVHGEPLLDPDEEAVRRFLRTIKNKLPDGGGLTFVWAGHAIPAVAGALKLFARDSEADLSSGLDATDVATKVAASGASQLLLVFDTCYSGAGADEVSRALGDFLRQRPPGGRQVYVGVITSCLPYETARDGLLGQRLRRLLRDGPQDPDLRRRWSAHSPMVSADDLGDALVREWDVDDQRPRFVREGVPLGMLPNPLYDPAAPQQVVEHLLRAARGGDVEDQRSWFTGRTVEVDRVVGWVTADEPGVYVVTGKAGTGKSAIVGRVVSSSNPAEREFLLRQGPLAHDDPGIDAVDAVIHARAVTVEQVARALDVQLVGAGLVPPHDAGRRNAAELVGAVQRAHEQGTTPVIVVDGLDEARGHAFELVDDLLLRLAPCATVVVATRDLPGPRDIGLVEALAPGDVIDLADLDRTSSTRQALHDYVDQRLRDVAQQMDPDLVAAHVVASTRDEELPFLLGRLVTDELRVNPVDTGRAGWERYVASTVEAAFDVDLVRTSAGDVAYGVEDARQQLTALTWAFGAGLPEDEWRAIAATSTGHEVGRDDITRVLEHLGRYVVQDGEDGTAVYRLAHQALADHLRPRFVASWQSPFDPDAQPVALALLGRYRDLIDAGVEPQQATYLWRHAWQHAAQAGPRGLAALRDLESSTPVLRLDTALAAREASNGLARWGQVEDALALSEEATTAYRTLAASDSTFRPALASAVCELSLRLAAVGRDADAFDLSVEGLDIYRELVEADAGYRPSVAMALIGVANRLAALGRRAEALSVTEDALAEYRELTATSSSYAPDLAMALNNLGQRLGATGRREEALSAGEEAVSIYGELAQESVIYR